MLSVSDLKLRGVYYRAQWRLEGAGGMPMLCRGQGCHWQKIPHEDRLVLSKNSACHWLCQCQRGWRDTGRQPKTKRLDEASARSADIPSEPKTLAEPVPPLVTLISPMPGLHLVLLRVCRARTEAQRIVAWSARVNNTEHSTIATRWLGHTSRVAPG